MQVVFAFPSNLTITSIDAERHPELQDLSTGSSELVQLTLWLMTERRKGDRSSWYPFLQALPVRRLHFSRFAFSRSAGKDADADSLVSSGAAGMVSWIAD